MDIQEYCSQKKEFAQYFYDYLQNENNDDYDFGELINIIQKQKYHEHREEFKLLFYFIMKIVDNYHRPPFFFQKIEKIFQTISATIQQVFTNGEILDIFIQSKLIILILIKNQIITLDQSIISTLSCTSNKKKEKYIEYFYPELDKSGFDFDNSNIKNDILSYDPDIFTNFDEKRLKGENESYICHLIREDLVEDFIAHVNKKNIQLSSMIKKSLFETNSFLIDKTPTLIEYCAFFGSIQIFQYLLMNNVQLKPTLWLYAIHGRNSQIIHLLEENRVEIENGYQSFLKESIKCHHNEFAHYFRDNFILKSDEDLSLISDFKNNINAYSFHYFNYEFFPDNFNNKYIIYYLCKYNYYALVKYLSDIKELDFRSKIVLYWLSFLYDCLNFNIFL